MNTNHTPKYDVFISYSYKADRDIAPRLQSSLEKLSKPWYRRRSIRVFRDETDLGAHPDLWSQIEERLTRSRNLILLCSPKSAKSRWVSKEIDHWLRLGRHDNLFFALTEGEIAWSPKKKDFNWTTTTALSPKLKGKLKQEPSWVDLREESDTNKSPHAFRHAVARLAAPIRGLDLEQLVSSDHRQHRRTLRHAWTAVCVLVLFALLATWQWRESLLAQRRAEAERDNALITQSRFLANAAQEFQRAGDIGNAVALARAALPGNLSEPERPVANEAVKAIIDSTTARRYEYLSMRAHEGTVREAQFSEGGEQVLSWGDDNIIRIWDASNGKLIHALEDHSPTLLGAMYSRDDKQVISRYEDGSVRIWDTANGKLTNILHGHDQAVIGMATHPKQPQLLTWGNDGKILTWDIESGQNRQAFGGHTKHPWRNTYLITASFSPSGDTILTNGVFSAKFWNPKTGKLKFEIDKPNGETIRARYSAGGALLLSTSTSGTVRIWDAANGKLKQELKGRNDWYIQASLDPSNSKIVTWGNDEIARLWQLGKSKPVATLNLHYERLVGARFHPEGTFVLTWSKDRTARLWKSEDGAAGPVLRGHTDEILGAIFSDNGNRIATWSADRNIRLWDTLSGNPIVTLAGHEDDIYGVKFSPDGERMLSWGADGTLRIWTPENQVPNAVFRWSAENTTDVFNLSEIDFLMTTQADGVTQLWHAKTGAPGPVLDGHSSAVSLYKVSRDKERLLTFSASGETILWDYRKSSPVAVLSRDGSDYVDGGFRSDSRQVMIWKKNGEVQLFSALTGEAQNSFKVPIDYDYPNISVRYSPKDPLILSVGGDRYARLWDANTGAQIVEMYYPKIDHFDTAEFSPDGKNIMTVAPYGSDQIRIWNVEDGNFRTLDGFTDFIGTVWYSSDGSRIFSSDTEDQIQILETETGSLIHTFNDHEEIYKDVKFTQDMKQILTWGSDRAVKVWSSKNFKLEAKLQHSGMVHHVLMSPDESLIASMDDQGFIKIWDGSNYQFKFLLKLNFFTNDGDSNVRRLFFSPGSDWIVASLASGPKVWATSWRLAAVDADQIIEKLHPLSPTERCIYTIDTEDACLSKLADR